MRKFVAGNLRQIAATLSRLTDQRRGEIGEAVFQAAVIVLGMVPVVLLAIALFSH